MKNYLFLFLLLPFCSAGQVTTWEPPSGFSSARYYQVKVNGVSVPVFDTPIASYAIFDFKGKAKVEVNSSFDIRWVQPRPLRLDIHPTYTSDHSFTINLDKPENVSLELNGRIRQQPLFLFASAPEEQKPSKTDKNVIWFESGKLYQNINLELEDNQTVYIEGGAVVQGYIFAVSKKNIVVKGRGILDGSFNNKTEGNHNRFLSFTDCENVSIKDIVLHNGTSWQIAFFHSNKMTVSNTRIVSESGSDDGIDIVRCRNVTVEGVFAHTKDDCVAVKSGGPFPADQATDNIVVRNCTFWNSLWGNAIEVGFELYSDEVKNIRFENIDIIHVEDGAALSIHNAGPARVHNIIFDNIRIEDSSQKLLDVAIFFSQWGPDGTPDKEFNSKYYLAGAWDGVQRVPEGTEEYHRKFRGKISDIIFKDIQVVGGSLPFSTFYGFDREHSVSKISIENLTYLNRKLTDTTAAKIRLRNTFDLKIK